MRMNMMTTSMGGNGGGSIESMFGENNMSSSDGMGNQNIQMKRRKSEPCMMDMLGMSRGPRVIHCHQELTLNGCCRFMKCKLLLPTCEPTYCTNCDLQTMVASAS